MAETGRFVPLVIAVQFLTRLPVSPGGQVSDEQVGLSVLLYPLVGLGIGAILFVVAIFCASASVFVAAALVVTGWVLLTGALHLDGLADCADAWIGALNSPVRSLEIMKDPCVGPVAVSILVLQLLLKYSAVVALLQSHMPGVLLWAPAVGRTIVIAAILWIPYIRPDGLGAVLVKTTPRMPARCLVFVVCLLVLLQLGVTTLLACVLVFITLRALLMDRLGGATGDAYGALIECIETTVLIMPLFL